MTTLAQPTIKLAEKSDLVWALQLYNEIYQGNYPDPQMTQYQHLLDFVEGKHACYRREDNATDITSSCQFMVVAKIEHGPVVGVVCYKYDPTNRFAKVYGAVVHPDYRGHKLTEQMMEFGVEQLKRHPEALDIIYATTRTVHKSAQVLTERQGYKKLGLFPNVHKTQLYETHGLVALFDPAALEKRLTDFELHPKLGFLYQIVQREMGLKELPIAKLENINQKKYSQAIPALETISAPNYVRHRLKQRLEAKEADLSFFPFHQPSVLLTSPDQSIEIFCAINEEDGHCAILGAHVGIPMCYTVLFKKMSSILRDLGVRYIEVITQANRVSVIDAIMKANFIPCAYFPAFQLREDKRLDYVVFSRSFEIFDFYNMQLEGANKDYLRQYYQSWQEIALSPRLWEEQTVQ